MNRELRSAGRGDGGCVYLVGAGPGDPELLTVRAAALIAAADVILRDNLVSSGALTGARLDAVVIDVGKIGGGHQVPQEETNRLMIEHARSGRNVVRLKGGDPFVFGRGGEEALACRAAGVKFEVVPGVTAGTAAPALAGIPVTHRAVSTGVAMITGHEARGKSLPQLDWQMLARFPGTLVFFMGVRSLPRICEQLIAGGRPPDEPAAIIERGSMSGQRSVFGTLATLAADAVAAKIGAPAVTVVGPVVEFGAELAWHRVGPLDRLRVAVTRPRARGSALAASLRGLGAEVIEAPVIVQRDLDWQLPPLAGVDLVVLTSPHGVDCLFARLRALGCDARALAGARVAVVGPGTAEALRAHGIEPDIVPARAVGDALAAELSGAGEIGSALVIAARGGRTVVADALKQAGADVTSVAPYVTVTEQLPERTRQDLLTCDWATVTSASCARALATTVGGANALAADGPRLASIGPITSAALRTLGLEPEIEATEHTPDGLVQALLAATTAG